MNTGKMSEYYEVSQNEILGLSQNEIMDFRLEQIEYDTVGNVVSCVVS